MGTGYINKILSAYIMARSLPVSKVTSLLFEKAANVFIKPSERSINRAKVNFLILNRLFIYIYFVIVLLNRLQLRIGK